MKASGRRQCCIVRWTVSKNSLPRVPFPSRVLQGSSGHARRSQTLIASPRSSSPTGRRLPASDLEQLVIGRIRRLPADEVALYAVLQSAVPDAAGRRESGTTCVSRAGCENDIGAKPRYFWALPRGPILKVKSFNINNLAWLCGQSFANLSLSPAAEFPCCSGKKTGKLALTHAFGGGRRPPGERGNLPLRCNSLHTRAGNIRGPCRESEAGISEAATATCAYAALPDPPSTSTTLATRAMCRSSASCAASNPTT
jgi:hypothetical protein